ncbi:MAG: hypothetical protein ACI8RD_006189 [Bacillariaceae sp.]|jgi:hypothetical protein
MFTQLLVRSRNTSSMQKLARCNCSPTTSISYFSSIVGKAAIDVESVNVPPPSTFLMSDNTFNVGTSLYKNQSLPVNNLNNNNLELLIIQAGRNSRKPKKANKGSRPCSRAGRRKRQEKIGKRSR